MKLKRVEKRRKIKHLFHYLFERGRKVKSKLIFSIFIILSLIGCKVVKEEALVIDIYQDSHGGLLSGPSTEWHMIVEFSDGQRCMFPGRTYKIGEVAIFPRYGTNDNPKCIYSR